MGVVYLAASDESSGANFFSDFLVTGWLAPEEDWFRFFNPAWQQRVLDREPKIPYLHVTEMRSRAWRETHGITQLQANDRLDEASNIIDTLGSLYPMQVKVLGQDFRTLFQGVEFQGSSGGRKRYEPDFYAFVTYIYAVLCRVKVKFPEAERVDFLVEQKSDFTRLMQDFHESMPNALRHIDRADLIPLVGKFISGTKEDIPLQAADFLCWHSQRAQAEKLEESDFRRWSPMAAMKGFSFEMKSDLMGLLATAFQREQKRLAASAS